MESLLARWQSAAWKSEQHGFVSNEPALSVDPGSSRAHIGNRSSSACRNPGGLCFLPVDSPGSNFKFHCGRPLWIFRICFFNYEFPELAHCVSLLANFVLLLAFVHSRKEEKVVDPLRLRCVFAVLCRRA